MYLPATTQYGDTSPNSPNVGKEPSRVNRDISLPVFGSLIIKQRTMQLIPPNTYQLYCDLSALESAIQLLNNWGQLFGNQSPCPLDRIIYILNNWAHWGGADFVWVQTTLMWLPRTQTSVSRSMKICAQRKAGWKTCERLSSLPFPRSLAVHHQSLAFRTRLCACKTMRKAKRLEVRQLMWHKIMTFNRFSLNWVL